MLSIQDICAIFCADIQFKIQGTIMSKSQNVKKVSKKEPAKSMKEKKAAKRDKKSGKKDHGLLNQ